MSKHFPVPYVNTAQTATLLSLERGLLDNLVQIEQWFRIQWQQYTPPFYGSVDLRNSGFKCAPVDTNLFPGGFNNLHSDFLPLCVQATIAAIERACPKASRVLLIPENHTRNTYYLDNVATLVRLLSSAGLEVRLGSLSVDMTMPTSLTSNRGDQILLEPMARVTIDGKDRLLIPANEAHATTFDPCLILLNNDLSGGIPAILKNLSQTLLPPLNAGWAVRRKSQHFDVYRSVANDFASLFKIDPWLIDPYFSVCRNINFSTREGEDELAQAVADILEKIRVKYQQYGIENPPFVIVKADAGTYGMGIMTARSPNDVRDLNRKQRNKMAVIKEGASVEQVLIQEGVYSFEQISDGVAEPVVYMMDRFVVGGFYRVNSGRSRDENLNAPGMRFEPLSFARPLSLPDEKSNAKLDIALGEVCSSPFKLSRSVPDFLPDWYTDPDAPPNRFYAYGVIARLALLAAAIELENN